MGKVYTSKVLVKINSELSKGIKRTNTDEVFKKLHENKAVNADYTNGCDSSIQKITTVNDGIKVLTKEEYEEVCKKVDRVRKAERAAIDEWHAEEFRVGLL